MSTRNYARLVITSEVMTSDEITNIVKLRPDQAWKPGDFRGKTGARHKNDGWVFNSKVPKKSSLEEHVDHLLGTLAPVAAQILSISHKAEVRFSCVVYSATSPPLFFEKGTIAQISALGASFDIDLYIVPDNDQPLKSLPSSE